MDKERETKESELEAAEEKYKGERHELRNQVYGLCRRIMSLRCEEVQKKEVTGEEKLQILTNICVHLIEKFEQQKREISVYNIALELEKNTHKIKNCYVNL